MKNKLPKGFKVKKQVLKSSKKKYNAIQKFKQVDGEIEAVEFAEWIHINAQPRLPNKNQWKMYNNSVVITTQELYEIFKNR